MPTDQPIEITVMSGPYDGQRRRLTLPREPERGYVLGRHIECDWSFSYDEQVSGRHARVFFEGGQWFVEDLKSTNKTYLGKRRADGTFAGREALKLEPNQPYPITDRQLLQLGRLWIQLDLPRTVNLAEEMDREGISDL